MTMKYIYLECREGDTLQNILSVVVNMFPFSPFMLGVRKEGDTLQNILSVHSCE